MCLSVCLSLCNALTFVDCLDLGSSFSVYAGTSSESSGQMCVWRPTSQGHTRNKAKFHPVTNRHDAFSVQLQWRQVHCMTLPACSHDSGAPRATCADFKFPIRRYVQWQSCQCVCVCVCVCVCPARRWSAFDWKAIKFVSVISWAFYFDVVCWSQRSSVIVCQSCRRIPAIVRSNLASNFLSAQSKLQLSL